MGFFWKACIVVLGSIIVLNSVTFKVKHEFIQEYGKNTIGEITHKIHYDSCALRIKHETGTVKVQHEGGIGQHNGW